MALPGHAAGGVRRDDVLRMLAELPDGLSDGEIARRLAASEAAVKPKTVNHLCRRMAAEGVLERVGTRPIRNRLVTEPSPSETHDDGSRPAAAPASPAPAGGGPARDVLQSWSRTVNVHAAVAAWLTGRGATIRSTTSDGGPASDLVVTFEGGELHVEVTGWPPDGARTPPTTVAGDWFSAAEHGATRRRRAHPEARVVIALPDTRRYRALAEHRAEALAGSGVEVWFVAPSGAVATP